MLVYGKYQKYLRDGVIFLFLRSLIRGTYMKESLKSLFVAILVMTLGFGQALAQEPQNYASVGYNMGSGVNTWVSVAGAGGYGQMNFFNAQSSPIVDGFANNQYGFVSMYARPWASGTVASEHGGTATVTTSFAGNAEASVQFSQKYGTGTYTTISKSVALSASSTGNASASVNGGFDVFVGARGNTPSFVIPAPPSPPGFPGSKG